MSRSPTLASARIALQRTVQAAFQRQPLCDAANGLGIALPGGNWSLRQITPENVHRLKVAWTHDTGDAITGEVFQVGQLVDVTGTSQGKGFAGSIKRHNFSSNRASHGNSVSHRAPASFLDRFPPTSRSWW